MDIRGSAFANGSLSGLTQTGGLIFSLGHIYRSNDGTSGTEIAALGKVESESVPTSYELAANYPNPFNPTTTLQFALPAPSKVRLVVFDVLGREVAILADGYYEAGVHPRVWDAHRFASGMYFARLSVRNESGQQVYSKTTKLLLAK